MPELDIDHKKTLLNTVPPHRKHVVVHTGRSDWASRIENGLEEGQTNPNRAMILKDLVGLKGPFTDVIPNDIMVTNSSAGLTDMISVFPDCMYFQLKNYDGVEADLVKSTLLPDDKVVEPLDRKNEPKEAEQRQRDDRLESPRGDPFSKSAKYDTAVIYICGHGARDTRCGVLGPLLRDEFKKQLDREESLGIGMKRPDVELVSHIGGHIFAGNVIIYTPDSVGMPRRGVWYGRVEPKHVEGILKETLGKGKIIEELFRGGLDFKSDPIRL